MLLSSVILVLQETLEAALLVSLLLAASQQLSHKMSWVIYAIGGGLAFSLVYALEIGHVSEWFEYTGQEIVNASLQISVTLLIAICTWVLVRGWTPENRQRAGFRSSLFTQLAAATVMLAITREGSEVLIYLIGFYPIKDVFHTVTVGSFIGLGIGISVGVLIYFGIMGLQGRWQKNTMVSLLALFSGKMVSQASLQLNQADWIPSTPVGWDSSSLLSEESLTGKLLYALIGYEATPALAQIAAYAAGVILILITAIIASRVQAESRSASV